MSNQEKRVTIGVEELALSNTMTLPLVRVLATQPPDGHMVA